MTMPIQTGQPDVLRSIAQAFGIGATLVTMRSSSPCFVVEHEGSEIAFDAVLIDAVESMMGEPLVVVSGRVVPEVWPRSKAIELIPPHLWRFSVQASKTVLGFEAWANEYCEEHNLRTLLAWISKKEIRAAEAA